MTPTPTPTPPLMTLRQALIFLISILIGLSVAALGYVEDKSLAEVALMGLGAGGASLPILHLLIGES